MPHGTTSGYYRDGAIALIGEHENGVPHGKVLTYAPNGEVYEVSHAKQGVFVSEKLMRNNPQERAAIQLRLKETSTEEFVRIWNGSLHK